MKFANKKQLASRIIKAANAASTKAAAGRRPRSISGDPMTLSLADCARQQGELASCRRDIAAFEAAWRIDTPEANELVIRMAREKRATRRFNRQRQSMYAACSAEDRRKADTYATLGGKARKNYRRRHSAALNRAGEVAGLKSQLDFNQCLQES